MAKTERLQVRLDEKTYKKLLIRKEMERRASISDMARILIEDGLEK